LFTAPLSQRPKKQRRTNRFSGARIAVLLTGQAFRAERVEKHDRSAESIRFCEHGSISAQHTASRALLSNVVQPLENSGATVDILFTFPACDNSSFFISTLKSWYGDHLVAQRTVRSKHVGHSFQLAYMLLRDYMQHGHSFDFVLSVRHDLELCTDIMHWTADLEKLIFFGAQVKLDCNFGDRSKCKPKTQDKMLWVPRQLLPKALGVLAHDHHDGDEDFNPHYLVEHFMHVPPAALVRMYHNLELINETCTPANEVKRVPPDLLGTLAPGVGLLRNCAASGTPFYRIVPYRRW